MLNYAPEVSFLLEEGLPVMIYSGLEDLICNSLSQHWFVLPVNLQFEWYESKNISTASEPSRCQA